MDTITKIATAIRVGPLQHKLLKQHLENIKSRVLISYKEVRWLSEGKVLVLFINMTNEEKTFLKTKISLLIF